MVVVEYLGVDQSPSLVSLKMEFCGMCIILDKADSKQGEMTPPQVSIQLEDFSTSSMKLTYCFLSFFFSPVANE